MPYLKQIDLFALCPSLRADIDLGAFAHRRWGTTWCWVGPKGAVTGLHSDDENNILYQLRGEKVVTLFPPACRPWLYPTGKYDPGTECCAADPDAPDAAAHPAFAASVRARARRATLRAGDALYIPRFHYHHVRTSRGTSISVNHFASSGWELVRFGVPRLLLEVLHQMGLFRSGYCVCHAQPRADALRTIRARKALLWAAAVAAAVAHRPRS